MSFIEYFPTRSEHLFIAPGHTHICCGCADSPEPTPGGGGGGGGGALIFFHIYAGSGHFFSWFKNINFNILRGFQEKYYFGGMMKLDIYCLVIILGSFLLFY